MQSLNPKIETAGFDSDLDVVRVARNMKFIVGRVPLPQFAAKEGSETVYPISCDPAYDLRTQSMMFERVLHTIGYQAKEIKKNLMISGMAPRFMVGSSQLGTVVYNIDKGLLTVDLQKTTLPDKWVP